MPKVARGLPVQTPSQPCHSSRTSQNEGNYRITQFFHVDRVDSARMNSNSNSDSDDDNSDFDIDPDADDEDANRAQPLLPLQLPCRCVSWNVEGWAAKLADPSVTEYLLSFDVICLTETFMIMDFDSTLLFHEYECIQKKAIKLSKMGRPSGGIIVLYKKSLKPYVSAIENEYDNLLILKVKKEAWNVDKDVTLFFYLSPPCG